MTVLTPEPTAGPASSRTGRSISSATLLRSGLMPVLLVLELIVFGVLSKEFFTAGNLSDLVVNSGDLALIAAGMTLVIMLSGIDVSVGPMLGVLTWGVATMTGAGLSPWVVVLTTVAAGALLGAVNGTVIVVGGVAPIIATLGMAAVYQTVLFLLWGSRDLFTGPVVPLLSGQKALGVPLMVIPILLVFVVLAYVLKMRRFGRHIYAIGNDATGARLLGVSVGRVTFGAYVLLGALVGLASMIYVGRVGVVQSNSGSELTLAAIAAVVVGGTSILGGQGGVVRTLGGLLFIAVLQKGIVLVGVPALWSGVMVGAAVALAVSVDVITRRQVDRRERGNR
ncbi:ABC transporter permease [Nakamurella silvestris]|nr:ABC transporter permease [Nakamurella silvestris]